MNLVLIGIGLVVGILIGSIGIGGVLLVPSLNYLADVPIHVAIASVMFSYLFSGMVGATMFARRGSIRWSMAGWLCLGAMPGAYVGAAAVSMTPAAVLELLIATIMIAVGVNALIERGESTADRVWSPRQLMLLGTISGFGSSMTGTGGPLVLVPILIWLKTPVLMSVGLSQVIQLPIAALATVGNWVHGTIDFKLGLMVALTLIVGVFVGARISHAVSSKSLKRLVSLVMVGVGAALVSKIAVHYLAR
ncbi:MAG: sulfite exporter TauE/SafE family protein [Gammaproteobacteria bacterium]|nr:sulfite exporter TauE/SafE family protein [Gammaproteobacteria bacterium]